MVLGENYDRSLWLMICGDQYNRDIIAECIRNIPYEKSEQIRKLILDKECDNVLSFENNNISYEIYMCENDLFIKTIYEKDGEKKILELFLTPLSYQEVLDMGVDTSVALGGFSHTTYINDISYGTTLDEYELTKTVIGNYVKLYVDNGVKCAAYKRVNIKRMPDKMNVNRFRTDIGVKRLIRGKKRK